MSFLIGLAGRAGSGKDTVATHLLVQHDYIQMSVAGPIREAVATLFCLTEDDFARENKERVLEDIGRSPRQLLQMLGTEFGRDLIGEDVWLKVLEKRIGLMLRVWRSEGWRNRGIVVSDIRMENEAGWVRSMGGIILHVERETAGIAGGHRTEGGVQFVEGDYRISNNSTFEELYARVDGIMDVLRRPDNTIPSLWRVH